MNTNWPWWQTTIMPDVWLIWQSQYTIVHSSCYWAIHQTKLLNSINAAGSFLARSQSSYSHCLVTKQDTKRSIWWFKVPIKYMFLWRVLWSKFWKRKCAVLQKHFPSPLRSLKKQSTVNGLSVAFNAIDQCSRWTLHFVTIFSNMCRIISKCC